MKKKIEFFSASNYFAFLRFDAVYRITSQRDKADNYVNDEMYPMIQGEWSLRDFSKQNSLIVCFVSNIRDCETCLTINDIADSGNNQLVRY